MIKQMKVIAWPVGGINTQRRLIPSDFKTVIWLFRPNSMYSMFKKNCKKILNCF